MTHREGWRTEGGERRGGGGGSKSKRGGGEFGDTDFEEVFDSLWVVAVALATYPLHLLHLTRLTGSLQSVEYNINRMDATFYLPECT